MKTNYNESIKLKMPFFILIIFLLLIQPFIVNYCINSGYSVSNILWIVFLSSYFFFGFAVFINEFIIKLVFIKILKGIEIKNNIEDYASMGLLIVPLALYYSWLFSTIQGNQDKLNLGLASMLITYYIFFKDKKLILYNDIIILGFKIIKLDYITGYTFYPFDVIGIKRNKIELKLKNGERLTFVRDPKNVQLFEIYLIENNIPKI